MRTTNHRGRSIIVVIVSRNIDIVVALTGMQLDETVVALTSKGICASFLPYTGKTGMNLSLNCHAPGRDLGIICMLFWLLVSREARQSS